VALAIRSINGQAAAVFEFPRARGRRPPRLVLSVDLDANQSIAKEHEKGRLEILGDQTLQRHDGHALPGQLRHALRNPVLDRGEFPGGALGRGAVPQPTDHAEIVVRTIARPEVRGAPQALASILYGVNVHDPMVFVATAAALGFVAVIASYAPARRAAAIDPISSLRSE